MHGSDGWTFQNMTGQPAWPQESLTAAPPSAIHPSNAQPPGEASPYLSSHRRLTTGCPSQKARPTIASISPAICSFLALTSLSPATRRSSRLSLSSHGITSTLCEERHPPTKIQTIRPRRMQNRRIWVRIRQIQSAIKLENGKSMLLKHSQPHSNSGNIYRHV